MALHQNGGREPSDQKEHNEPTLMSNPYNPNSAAYLAYPVKHVMSSLYRRLTEPPEQPVNKLLDAPTPPSYKSDINTPPKRHQSPFQPPPLTGLSLEHTLSAADAESLLLTRSLAEEIRLLVPLRLQLIDRWKLAYSLEVHGSSLGTLYEMCARVSLYTQRSGYVLVVQDGSEAASNGSVFGAYLTDAPAPAQHYYGTGECFLWRASILPSMKNIALVTSNSTNSNGVPAPPSQDLLELAGLPPPPSADTTHATRTTTVRGKKRNSQSSSKPTSPILQSAIQTPSNLLKPPSPTPSHRTGTSTPDRIRFKAFPYSGINDFMIYCQPSFLSVGGGDGHYGLWLDDTLDNGVSQKCPTFGNEPLSEEGEKADRMGKFEVFGVEVWYVGA